MELAVRQKRKKRTRHPSSLSDLLNIARKYNGSPRSTYNQNINHIIKDYVSSNQKDDADPTQILRRIYNDYKKNKYRRSIDLAT